MAEEQQPRAEALTDAEPDALSDRLERRQQRRRWLIPLVVAVVAVGVRLVMIFPVMNTAQDWVRYFCQHGEPGQVRCLPGEWGLVAHLSAWVLTYAAVALPAIALVQVGFRRSFWFPFVLPALVGVAMDPPFFFSQQFFDIYSDRRFTPGLWTSSNITYAVSGLVLALAPAAALAMVDRGARSHQGFPRQAIAGLTYCWAVSLVPFVFLAGYADEEGVLAWGVVPLAIGVFLVGAMLGARRPWWPWLHVLFPLLLPARFALDAWIDGVTAYGLSSAFFREDLPLAAICLVASLWRSISERLERAPAGSRVSAETDAGVKPG
jgi:hypothetical protein